MSLPSRRQWRRTRVSMSGVEVFGCPVGAVASQAVGDVCDCGAEGVGEGGEKCGPPRDAGGGVDVDYEEVGWETDADEGDCEVSLEGEE